MTHNIKFLSLRDFFADVYQPKRLREASPETIDEYTWTLNALQKFNAGRDVLTRELCDERVEHFLLWLKDEQGLAAPTRNKHLRQIAALWRFARRRKIGQLIGANNTPLEDCEVEPARVTKPVGESWPLDDMERLLSTAAQWPGGWPVDVDGQRTFVAACDYWPAKLLFLYAVGPRIAASLALPSDAVEFFAIPRVRCPLCGRYGPIDETRSEQTCVRDCKFALAGLRKIGGLAYIDGSLQKSNKTLPTRLPWEISEPLRLARVEGYARLLPFPFGYNTALRRFKQIVAAAGLSSRKYWFHKLRATHAVECENEGGNATESLQHSDRRVTSAYLDPLNSTKPCAAELLPPIRYQRQLRLHG